MSLRYDETVAQALVENDMTIASPILKPEVQPDIKPEIQTEIQLQKLKLTDAPVMLFSGLTWREFQVVEKLLDRSGYRFSFLDGVLEIAKMPKELHETTKKRIAGLLELYFLLAGFDFNPMGSMTLESEVDRAKREPDESYRLKSDSKRPDLLLEVVVTSGGLDKLELYKRLKISEVWFWEDGVLDLYHLRQEVEDLHYEKIKQSEEVPGIDLELLKRCILMNSHVEALKVWQKSINQ
jgi:Uma2 family endonuclease